MSLIASAVNNSNFKLAPEGNHIARCISVIDLGHQKSEWKGKELINRKVFITFELPEEKEVFTEERGEEPFVVSKEYTLSLSEKANLRKDLESWRGKAFSEDELKGFDITKLLDAPCMLNVIHKTSASGNQYPFISSISKLHKSIKAPGRFNDLIEFSLDNENHLDVFQNIPEWIQNKIKESSEWRAKQNPNMTVVNEDKDVTVNDVLPDDETPF